MKNNVLCIPTLRRITLAPARREYDPVRWSTIFMWPTARDGAIRQHAISMQALFGAALVCLLFWAPSGLAQQTAGAAPETAPETRDAESWRHLEALIARIEATRGELRERREELRASVNEREKAGLSRQIEQLTLDLESLQTAWEMLATETMDLSLFGVKTEKAFDWRAELQSVFEPILVELKRLTERPRKLERLRGEQVYYQERVEAADAALKSIVRNRESAPTPRLKEAFGRLEERWQRRYDDLSNRLTLIDFDMQRTLAPAGARKEPAERLQELLSGRVLNFVIAIVVMVFVYLLMRAFARLYDRYVMRRARPRGVFAARVGNLFFYLFTTITVLLSGMAVFYARGDWLLLGLMIIMLVGAGLAAQRSLPRFLTEVRLMLNLGPVREGERMIYQGLPWRIKTLGFHATLENPLLHGGTINLPLRALVDFHSRRYEPDEPWFPAQAGEYVLLADGTFGKVLMQTPEQVQLLAMGSAKTYRIADFLGQSPRNLSHGFTVAVNFGLDYRHQAQIVSAICELMARELSAGIAAIDLAAHLTQLSVEFAKAGESSLDLALIAGFDGAAADGYFRIQRLLQQLAVEVCNRHDWVIPFNQLTVHVASAPPTAHTTARSAS